MSARDPLQAIRLPHIVTGYQRRSARRRSIGLGSLAIVVLVALLPLTVTACTTPNPRYRGDSGTDPNSPAKELTSLSFLASDNPELAADAIAVIDGTQVHATVPFGRNTSLVATFKTTGARVEVDGVSQESGATRNTFSSPMIYRVIAGDGSTQDYTVTVSTPVQHAYIKASNPGNGDGFGIVALSADGSTLAVGAITEDNRNQDSGAVYVFARSDAGWSQQAYLKAANAGAGDIFGIALAFSADGNTLAVGARDEDGGSKGIGGPDNDNVSNSGAVYVYVRSGTSWNQQAYIKASEPAPSAEFGGSVTLSANGDTLAVGALSDSSSGLPQSGSAYVFTRVGVVWSQQAILTASDPRQGYYFGVSVSLSADGNALAVGAFGEGASAGKASGAAYLFTRSGTAWGEQASFKPPNPNSGRDSFGVSVSLAADGHTLAVGARWDDSAAKGVGADPNNNSAPKCGAAYVFTLTGTEWRQQEYIKASNAGAGDEFGQGVALSADGNTLVVSAWGEASMATGINGDPNDNSMFFAGAAYAFTRTGSTWTQKAYIKASNTGGGSPYGDGFGGTIALSADGTTFAVEANGEDSGATGVNGNQNDNSLPDSGAVYIFH